MNYPSIPASHLRQEYDQQKSLFERQPVIVQRFLERQAQPIADGLVSKTYRIHFSLPDRVVMRVEHLGQDATITIPNAQRNFNLGGFWDEIRHHEIRDAIFHCLRVLEQSPDQAVAFSAGLLRFATSSHMVTNMLPSGRSVTYISEDDESIPSIPGEDSAPESAITQASDAIAEEGQGESGRGELQSPFVPAARRFFLPQWVAFDLKGKLLVASEKDAEAHVHSMQKYAQILHRSSALAPYMVASDEYQRKRYGILGQLVNQGRALAQFKTNEIIRLIKDRAQKGSLNRGLSITMPYFDDQILEMDELNFEVIPAGRIMFIPAFVVRASLSEQAKVSQDTRLNPSTRKHLLEQLKALETAFMSD
jgi:hypothetical protein